MLEMLANQKEIFQRQQHIKKEKYISYELERANKGRSESGV